MTAIVSSRCASKESWKPQLSHKPPALQFPTHNASKAAAPMDGWDCPFTFYPNRRSSSFFMVGTVPSPSTPIGVHRRFLWLGLSLHLLPQSAFIVVFLWLGLSLHLLPHSSSFFYGWDCPFTFYPNRRSSSFFMVGTVPSPSTPIGVHRHFYGWDCPFTFYPNRCSSSFLWLGLSLHLLPQSAFIVVFYGWDCPFTFYPNRRSSSFFMVGTVPSPSTPIGVLVVFYGWDCPFTFYPNRRSSSFFMVGTVPSPSTPIGVHRRFLWLGLSLHLLPQSAFIVVFYGWDCPFTFYPNRRSSSFFMVGTVPSPSTPIGVHRRFLWLGLSLHLLPQSAFIVVFYGWDCPFTFYPNRRSSSFFMVGTVPSPSTPIGVHRRFLWLGLSLHLLPQSAFIVVFYGWDCPFTFYPNRRSSSFFMVGTVPSPSTPIGVHRRFFMVGTVPSPSTPIGVHRRFLWLGLSLHLLPQSAFIVVFYGWDCPFTFYPNRRSSSFFMVGTVPSPSTPIGVHRRFLWLGLSLHLLPQSAFIVVFYGWDCPFTFYPNRRSSSFLWLGLSLHLLPQSAFIVVFYGWDCPFTFYPNRRSSSFFMVGTVPSPSTPIGVHRHFYGWDCPFTFYPNRCSSSFLWLGLSLHLLPQSAFIVVFYGWDCPFTFYPNRRSSSFFMVGTVPSPSTPIGVHRRFLWLGLSLHLLPQSVFIVIFMVGTVPSPSTPIGVHRHFYGWDCPFTFYPNRRSSSFFMVGTVPSPSTPIGVHRRFLWLGLSLHLLPQSAFIVVFMVGTVPSPSTPIGVHRHFYGWDCPFTFYPNRRSSSFLWLGLSLHLLPQSAFIVVFYGWDCPFTFYPNRCSSSCFMVGTVPSPSTPIGVHRRFLWLGLSLHLLPQSVFIVILWLGLSLHLLPQSAFIVVFMVGTVPSPSTPIGVHRHFYGWDCPFTFYPNRCSSSFLWLGLSLHLLPQSVFIVIFMVGTVPSPSTPIGVHRRFLWLGMSLHLLPQSVFIVIFMVGTVPSPSTPIGVHRHFMVGTVPSPSTPIGVHRRFLWLGLSLHLLPQSAFIVVFYGWDCPFTFYPNRCSSSFLWLGLSLHLLPQSVFIVVFMVGTVPSPSTPIGVHRRFYGWDCPFTFYPNRRSSSFFMVGTVPSPSTPIGVHRHFYGWDCPFTFYRNRCSSSFLWLGLSLHLLPQSAFIVVFYGWDCPFTFYPNRCSSSFLWLGLSLHLLPQSVFIVVFMVGTVPSPSTPIGVHRRFYGWDCPFTFYPNRRSSSFLWLGLSLHLLPQSAFIVVFYGWDCPFTFYPNRCSSSFLWLGLSLHLLPQSVFIVVFMVGTVPSPSTPIGVHRRFYGWDCPFTFYPNRCSSSFFYGWDCPFTFYPNRCSSSFLWLGLSLHLLPQSAFIVVFYGWDCPFTFYPNRCSTSFLWLGLSLHLLPQSVFIVVFLWLGLSLHLLPQSVFIVVFFMVGTVPSPSTPIGVHRRFLWLGLSLHLLPQSVFIVVFYGWDCPFTFYPNRRSSSFFMVGTVPSPSTPIGVHRRVLWLGLSLHLLPQSVFIVVFYGWDCPFTFYPNRCSSSFLWLGLSLHLLPQSVFIVVFLWLGLSLHLLPQSVFIVVFYGWDCPFTFYPNRRSSSFFMVGTVPSPSTPIGVHRRFYGWDCPFTFYPNRCSSSLFLWLGLSLHLLPQSVFIVVFMVGTVPSPSTPIGVHRRFLWLGLSLHLLPQSVFIVVFMVGTVPSPSTPIGVHRRFLWLGLSLHLLPQSVFIVVFLWLGLSLHLLPQSVFIVVFYGWDCPFTFYPNRCSSSIFMVGTVPSPSTPIGVHRRFLWLGLSLHLLPQSVFIVVFYGWDCPFTFYPNRCSSSFFMVGTVPSPSTPIGVHRRFLWLGLSLHLLPQSVFIVVFYGWDCPFTFYPNRCSSSCFYGWDCPFTFYPNRCSSSFFMVGTVPSPSTPIGVHRQFLWLGLSLHLLPQSVFIVVFYGWDCPFTFYPNRCSSSCFMVGTVPSPSTPIGVHRHFLWLGLSLHLLPQSVFIVVFYGWDCPFTFYPNRCSSSVFMVGTVPSPSTPIGVHRRFLWLGLSLHLLPQSVFIVVFYGWDCPFTFYPNRCSSSFFMVGTCPFTFYPNRCSSSFFMVGTVPSPSTPIGVHRRFLWLGLSLHLLPQSVFIVVFYGWDCPFTFYPNRCSSSFFMVGTVPSPSTPIGVHRRFLWLGLSLHLLPQSVFIVVFYGWDCPFTFYPNRCSSSFFMVGAVP